MENGTMYEFGSLTVGDIMSNLVTGGTEKIEEILECGKKVRTDKGTLINKDNLVCFRIVQKAPNLGITDGWINDEGQLVVNGETKNQYGAHGVRLKKILFSMPGHILCETTPYEQGCLNSFFCYRQSDDYFMRITDTSPQTSTIRVFQLRNGYFLYSEHREKKEVMKDGKRKQEEFFWRGSMHCFSVQGEYLADYIIAIPVPILGKMDNITDNVEVCHDDTRNIIGSSFDENGIPTMIAFSINEKVNKKTREITKIPAGMNHVIIFAGDSPKGCLRHEFSIMIPGESPVVTETLFGFMIRTSRQIVIQDKTNRNKCIKITDPHSVAKLAGYPYLVYASTDIHGNYLLTFANDKLEVIKAVVTRCKHNNVWSWDTKTGTSDWISILRS